MPKLLVARPDHRASGASVPASHRAQLSQRSGGVPTPNGSRDGTPRNGRALQRTSANAKPKATKKKATKKTRAGSISAAAFPTPADRAVAALTLQRWWRMQLARREALAGLELLREWDLLLVQLGAQRHAATRLQCAARRRRARRALREAAALRIQCAARRRLARRVLLALAAVRLQCAARQKLARKALHDAYWAYAFGLMEEDAATRLALWWRMCVARREARAGLALLREYDALVGEVRAAQARRWAAALVVQRRARRFTRTVWARRWAAVMSGDVAAVEDLSNEDNPFSEHFVGAAEHRRRVEAKFGAGGKLRKHGAPSRQAMARALPSQMATLLNTLRFVDAVNALISRRSVKVVEGADGALYADYEALMAWGEQALQARFAGATQYLKAAKSFGLLHYGGEMLAFLPKAATFEGHDKGGVTHATCQVVSHTLGHTRGQLLEAALRKPERVVPAMFASAMDPALSNEVSRAAAIERLSVLVNTVEPFRAMAREYLVSSFESELRECTFLLDDEFWPSDDDDDDDDDDADLKRVADRAAVERVLGANDFFDVLSLPRDCSKVDIKKSFFKLSKEVRRLWIDCAPISARSDQPCLPCGDACLAGHLTNASQTVCWAGPSRQERCQARQRGLRPAAHGEGGADGRRRTRGVCLLAPASGRRRARVGASHGRGRAIDMGTGQRREWGYPALSQPWVMRVLATSAMVHHPTVVVSASVPAVAVRGAPLARRCCFAVWPGGSPGGSAADPDATAVGPQAQDPPTTALWRCLAIFEAPQSLRRPGPCQCSWLVGRSAHCGMC